jgi:hypothetical protein
MEINSALREHQDEHDEALSILHKYVPPIIEQFFGNLPVIALSFEELRLGNACSYRDKDGLALYYRITLNSLYKNRRLADHLRDVAHGCCHVWQQLHGKPSDPPYHNSEFRTKMRKIGIPCDSRGHSLGMQEPFLSLLQELGVEDQVLHLKQKEEKKKTRTSTRLKPWQCKCTRIWASIRVGVKAFCFKCSHDFQPQWAREEDVDD